MNTSVETNRPALTTIEAITPKILELHLKTKILELANQPEFQWQDERANYAIDSDGTPAVRVAAANSDLQFDLWQGLRNPAKVGLYPAGYAEIWDFHANNRKRRTDDAGRATIFQVADTFEKATKRLGRAVILSAMLPVHPNVFTLYNRYINDRSMAPWDGYCKVWGELNKLLDRAITRLAFDLVNKDRVVVVMNDANTARISTESVPIFHQGASHGVCKKVNYSQRSIAVLTGLAQFGVSRNVFRDEMHNGAVSRLTGVLRSIILFDNQDIPANGQTGVRQLTPKWLAHLQKMSDFTITDSEINRQRFCTFIPESGEPGCGKCITACPSGAMPNSSPTASGTYSEKVSRQQHRFWDGALQFDNASCLEYRTQHADLYSEWMCARCLSICGTDTFKREAPAEQART